MKILRPINWSQYGHFVHCMQYWYWITSNIIHDPDDDYVCVTPRGQGGREIQWRLSRYVDSYLNRILLKFPNLKLVAEHPEPGIEFYFRDDISDDFIYNDSKLRYKYKKWFPYDNSDLVRRIFVDDLPDTENVKIGIVNRKDNRRITNIDQLSERLSVIPNANVDVTYFEDKDFNYQVDFFNSHTIIISPHGAQLCSIPFMKPGSLVIECAHEEWHPYDYFPGLSYASNMYHAMIVGNHKRFPEWCSNKYIVPGRGRSNNSKLDIEVNIDKVISVINKYLSNNMVSKLCNLY